MEAGYVNFSEAVLHGLFFAYYYKNFCMVKKMYLMFVVMLMSLIVIAQDEPKFGLRGGLNLSDLAYSDNYSTDWRAGFHLGALSHIHITPSFSLQPEVYFSSQGAKLPYGTGKLSRKLQYINVPVLLQYNFNNGLRLQGGPQLGFLLNASDKYNDQELNTISTDDFKNIDFSITLGLSYLMYSGFGVDARYNIGISNINDNGTVKIKNSVGQFGIFYLFDHKHKSKSK